RTRYHRAMRMPTPDARVIAARAELIRALRRLLPAEGAVIAEDEALAVYESDGLSAYAQRPLAVVLPETTAQVAEVLKLAKAMGVKVVPRGAGTGLSGGALPL